jgi:hypothetical protein
LLIYSNPLRARVLRHGTFFALKPASDRYVEFRRFDTNAFQAHSAGMPENSFYRPPSWIMNGRGRLGNEIDEEAR